MDGEHYLRLRAEEVIAGAARPALDVVDALEGLGSVALSLAGAGLVDPATAAAVLDETSDALVLRGLDWLVHGLPDSGAAALHEVAATPGPGGLCRVVALAAAVDTAGGARQTVTSLEVAADQAAVRLVDDEGGTVTWRFTPPPAPEDTHLELQLTPGCLVRVPLGGGVDVRPWPTVQSSVTAATYLERLVWQQLAKVRRDPTAEGMTTARRRVQEAAETMSGVGAAGALPPAPLLAAFDATLVGARLVEPGPAEAGLVSAPEAWRAIMAPPAAGGSLVRVVPIAGRLPEAAGGWEVASLEQWPDDWRLMVVGAPDGPWCVWSATDAAGHAYGGAPVGPGVVRFDPPLGSEWTAVTVALIDAGQMVELEITR